MNPAIKAQWVAALRSGEYVQGTGKLRKRTGYNETDQFCCLGVLCDLAVKAGVPIEVASLSSGPGYEFFTYDHNCATPPEDVVEWATADSESMEFLQFQSRFDVLTGMNDDLKDSFDVIAKYIEETM